MEKYHKTDICPVEKENERDENYEASNPQIDSERTKDNYRRLTALQHAIEEELLQELIYVEVAV